MLKSIWLLANLLCINIARSQESVIFPANLPPPFHETPARTELEEWANAPFLTDDMLSGIYDAALFTFQENADRTMTTVTVPIKVSYYDYKRSMFLGPETSNMDLKKIQTRLNKDFNDASKPLGVLFDIQISWEKNAAETFAIDKTYQSLHMLILKKTDPTWERLGQQFVWKGLFKIKKAPRAFASRLRPRSLNSICNYEPPEDIKKWIEEEKKNHPERVVEGVKIPEPLCKIVASVFIDDGNDFSSTLRHEATHFILRNIDAYDESGGVMYPALKNFSAASSTAAIHSMEVATFLFREDREPKLWDDYVKKLSK